MEQPTFTDVEYAMRRRKTLREEFLDSMDRIIPWKTWVGMIEPFYLKEEHEKSSMRCKVELHSVKIFFGAGRQVSVA